MTVETHVDDARSRVERELRRTAEKRRAFADFHGTVQSIDADARSVRTPGDGPSLAQWAASPTGCREVRRAFTEHLESHCGDELETPDTVHEAIATEFSRELALSLAAPGSPGSLSPTLKRAVLDETDRRRDELAVTKRALERELTSLEGAAEDDSAVVDWLAERDRRPLRELDFAALTARHESLDDHLSSLDEVAAERQSVLDSTTGGPETIGVSHGVLIEYLYAEFPVTHPVLATVARLASLCRDAQVAVRDHLTRRV